MDYKTGKEGDPMLHRNLARKAGRKLKQYIAAATVSLGALSAGTCLAWTSPALAQLEGNSTTEAFTVTQKEGATIGGIMTIGALFSAIPAGYFADKLGRKSVIYFIALTFLLNWILIILSQNVTTIIIGRIFAGMGIGAIGVAGPMYIGEIAEASVRGVLGALINMFLCCGILMTCVFGAFTTWRTLSAILALVPIALGVMLVFMPETPVYLIKKKKLEAAEASLREFRGNNYDIASELKDIEKEIEESQNSTTILQLFLSKANRRSFFAVVPVMAFQQLCGVNAVVFYTVPIFKAAGSSLSPELAGIIVGLVQVLSAYFSLFIIEKANRRFYLMLSSAGMLLFLTGLGMYFQLKQFNYDISYLGFIPITCCVLFMILFSIGYGPVPWMLMGELFPAETKGIGNGFAILTSWTCAFLITFFFPIINISLGAHVSFYICASFMAIATVYVYFMVPETRGKSLVQIQEILNR